MADILVEAQWSAERLWSAIGELRADATPSQVGPTEADLTRIHDALCALSDREFALRAALIEVVAAARKQLENTGRGIEPSERLQEAFDAADELVSRK